MLTQMGLLFFVLAFMLVASQYLVFRYLWRSADQEAIQRLHWSVASDLAPRLQELMLESRQDSSELRMMFAQLQRLYPHYEVYILDREGFVVESAFNTPAGERHPLFAKAVDTKILDQSLKSSVNRRFPIYTESFDGSGRQLLFSVARIRHFGAPAYLYVVVESENQRTLGRAVETRYLVRAGILVSAFLFCLVLLLGIFLSRGVVRRFRRFISAVDQIGQGVVGTRVETTGNDEIALLGERINSMAQEIERNVEALKQTDIWRREMTAALSHDLKGPLASLTAHIEQTYRLLGAEPKAIEAKLEVLQRNTNTLQRYVDDILELSRLEAGEIKPEIVPFLVSEILEEELIPRFSAIAEERKVLLELSLDRRIEIVYADPALISRAISNLVSNAIQYTQEGGRVLLSCALEKERVLIEVEDNGPGFGKDSVENLLKPFARGDAARSKKNPGSGLGLAIVKSIVQAHGQELTIDTAAGKGTKIGFCLMTNKEAVELARPLQVSN